MTSPATPAEADPTTVLENRVTDGAKHLLRTGAGDAHTVDSLLIGALVLTHQGRPGAPRLALRALAGMIRKLGPEHRSRTAELAFALDEPQTGESLIAMHRIPDKWVTIARCLPERLLASMRSSGTNAADERACRALIAEPLEAIELCRADTHPGLRILASQLAEMVVTAIHIAIALMPEARPMLERLTRSVVLPSAA